MTILVQAQYYSYYPHSNKFQLKNEANLVLSPCGKCLGDLPRKILPIVYRQTAIVCKRKFFFVQLRFPRPTTTCTWTCPVNRDFNHHSPRYTLQMLTIISPLVGRGFPMELTLFYFIRVQTYSSTILLLGSSILTAELFVMSQPQES